MRVDLTIGSWETLLQAFDTNPTEAGEQYEEMRRSLIIFFTFRGATDPSHLTDLTFDRVAKILDSGKAINSKSFFYGVARNIWREHLAQTPPTLPLNEAKNLPTPPMLDDDKEGINERLTNSLNNFSNLEREILIGYYNTAESRPETARKTLAKRLNIRPKTLRNKACLLRSRLAECLSRDV